MLFRERRREKNEKRKPSQICKDIRGGGGGGVCACACVWGCVCVHVAGQQSQDHTFWPEKTWG